MATAEARERRWHKAGYSNGGAGACVELPHALDAVRDSKNGDVLELTRPAVVGLLRTVTVVAREDLPGGM